MKRKMTTTTMMKKSALPTTNSRPPAPQTHTCQWKTSTAAASTLSREALSGNHQAPLRKHQPPEESGAAGAQPPPAAGGRCFPRGAGRQCLGPSRPAVKAARPAVACHPAWSSPGLSAATPPGRRRHCTANTFHPPPRGARPRSKLRLRCSLLLVTSRPEPGRLPHHSGYSTGPLGACRGRAQVQGTFPFSR